MLRRCSEQPSPFYRARIASGVAPLAPTTRAELLADQLAHLPHGTRRPADAAPPVRAGITGTGSELLVLTFTAADLRRERAAGTALLRSLGITPGMRVANALPGALATPGSLIVGDVIEELGALDVPLGSPDSEAAATQVWSLLDRVQPQVLIVDPTSGERLLRSAPPTERPWLSGVIWLHQAANPPSFPSTGQGGGRGHRHWLAIPEATSFAAGSCEAGSLHIERSTIAEVITASGDIAAEGNGTLLLTPLELDTPLLRYDSGVAVRLRSDGCRCGSAGAVIEIACGVITRETSWTSSRRPKS
ncbi:MAG TPA: hypothetical protein VEB21_14075 [Terriglobales bacterium]|nr:hypothetical protein [Terriglobales bacterium]